MDRLRKLSVINSVKSFQIEIHFIFMVTFTHFYTLPFLSLFTDNVMSYIAFSFAICFDKFHRIMEIWKTNYTLI